MILAILFIANSSATYTFSLGAYVLDLSLRIDLNSLGLCSLYWLWTNTYYLYTLFIATLLLIFFNSHMIKYSLALLFIPLYLLPLYFEISHNLSMASIIDPYYLDLGFYNLLLNNSINKLHPALIYISAISLIVLIKFKLSYRLHYRVTRALIAQLLIIINSLILGGWWAYQEGSWGGWWNWDASEMFGLAILTALVVTSHNSVYVGKDHTLLFRNLVYILFAYYAFLQLNFSLISHNFGIRQGDLVDFRVIYVFAFIMFGIYIKLSLLHKSKLKSINDNDRSVLRRTLPVFMLLAILSYVTTLELWASLWWKMLSVDLQNELNLVEPLNVLILTVVHIRYVSIGARPLLPILMLAYAFSAILPVVALIWLYAFRPYKSHHQHLVLSLTLLYLFYYTSYSTINPSLNLPHAMSNNFTALNLPLLSGVSNYSLIGSCFFSCTDSSLLLNGAETKPFTLLNSNSRTLQIYYTSLSDILTNLVVSDFYNIVVIYAALALGKLNLSYINYSVTKF